MTMTDPIADMLTRIRNGIRNRRRSVTVPRSRMKRSIAKVLQDEGYITGFAEEGEGPQGTMRIDLKYGPDGELIINRIDRRSRPGRRIFEGTDTLKPVLNGLGIAVVSTSRGVMSDRQARRLRVGGEVLCEVW